MPNLAADRIVDPVLTSVVQGYANANSVAPFVAPVVPVNARAGNIIKFTKEQFLLTNTRRAPGTSFKRLGTGFTKDKFYVNQHAMSGEVPFERYEEALAAQQIDLRNRAALRATAAIAQGWEYEVTTTITDATLYEANNQEVASGTRMFDNASSDPEKIVQEWKEAIRAQIGMYPNSAVIDTYTWNALKFHPVFRDRVKHTSIGSVTLDMVATWFELSRGIRVAQRVYQDPETLALTDFMPKGTMAMFFSPDGEIGDGFQTVGGNDISTPAAFYTYELDGYPVAYEERYDPNDGLYISDVIAEQAIVPVGLGENEKIGASFLASGLVAA